MSDNIEMYETTDEDFIIFKQECQKWIEFFGLFGWDVFYYHENLKNRMFANCTYTGFNRIASIRLNKEFLKEHYSVYQLKQTAFHEICELLFARIHIINDSRFCGNDEMEEEIHNIIRILENKLFKMEMDKED